MSALYQCLDDRLWPLTASGSNHQHRPKVVHIRVRRPGEHFVAQRFEKPVGIVAVEVVLQFEAERGGALQGVGGDDGSGVVLHAVDAVGVCGQCPDSADALQRLRQPHAELACAAAA